MQIFLNLLIINHYVQITQEEYESIVPYFSNKNNSMVWEINYTCASYAIDIFNMAVGITFKPTSFTTNLAEQILYMQQTK